MNVVIVAIGSVGDVLPFCGLAARLRAAGHRVAVAAQETFADAVRSAGAEPRPLPGDVRAQLTGPDGQAWTTMGNRPAGLRAQVRILTAMMDALSAGLPGAVAGADVLVLHNSAAAHGYETARALGVPGMTVGFFPTVPTTEFTLAARSFGPWNRLAGKARRWLEPVDAWSSISRSFQDFQRRLGRPATSLNEVRAQAVADPTWPILHCYSPVLAPRPADWRPGVEVVGYLWPPAAPDWKPPAALADFLAAGPPPVFVGFGSSPAADTERMPDLVAAAVRRAGVRAVVQSGWSGLDVSGEDVLTIGEAPHDWLFPRTRAVVYHGSAGTTGAVLRAGVPAIPVPVLPDCHFSAGRLRRMGVSPGWVPRSRLNPGRLAALIRAVVNRPDYSARARELSRVVLAEDGAARVEAVIAACADRPRT